MRWHSPLDTLSTDETCACGFLLATQSWCDESEMRYQEAAAALLVALLIIGEVIVSLVSVTMCNYIVLY